MVSAEARGVVSSQARGMVTAEGGALDSAGPTGPQAGGARTRAHTPGACSGTHTGRTRTGSRARARARARARDASPGAGTGVTHPGARPGRTSG